MTAFDNIEIEKYKAEAQQNWGDTGAYKEYTKKTKDYSKDKWNSLADEMSHIFAEFSVCMKNGKEPDSDQTQGLVKALQNHINENFYLCTNENLAALGQMYVADERFKNNIDKNGEGTAEFVSEAIKTFCER